MAPVSSWDFGVGKAQRPKGLDDTLSCLQRKISDHLAASNKPSSLVWHPESCWLHLTGLTAVISWRSTPGDADVAGYQGWQANRAVQSSSCNWQLSPQEGGPRAMSTDVCAAKWRWENHNHQRIKDVRGCAVPSFSLWSSWHPCFFRCRRPTQNRPKVGEAGKRVARAEFWIETMQYILHLPWHRDDAPFVWKCSRVSGSALHILVFQGKGLLFLESNHQVLMWQWRTPTRRSPSRDRRHHAGRGGRSCSGVTKMFVKPVVCDEKRPVVWPKCVATTGRCR